MASLIQGLAGLIILALGVPLFLGKVPPNSLYGLRTDKTLENEEVWYRGNRFAGAALVVAGALILLASTVLARSMFEGPLGMVIVLGVVLLALVASLAYVARL